MFQKKLFLFIVVITSSLFSQKNPTDYINFYAIQDINFDVFDDPTYSIYYKKGFNTSVFLKNYFNPWETTSTSISDSIYKEYFLFDTMDVKSPCIGENYQQFNFKIKNDINANTKINKTEIGKHISYGITITTTNIRRFPTDEICFKKVRNAGEGYPFDYFQYSSLWIASPVTILTTSNDGLWYFINSQHCKGWVKTSEIALIDINTIKKIKQLALVTPVKDKFTVKNKTNAFSIYLGTLLPKFKNSILLPKKQINNFVAFDTIAINNNFKNFPIAFNKKNVKQILTELHLYKHTWKGLNNGRDCSSTLKDFYTPFGLWLPRNSEEQKTSGGQIDLIGLGKEKLNTINNNAIPFLTGIYQKGHMALYIGKDLNNTSVIFHNIWGIKGYYKNRKLRKLAKKRNIFGLFGIHQKTKKRTEVRFNIGKAVFTSIEPSKKLDKVFKGLQTENFLENISVLTIFN